MRWLCLGRRKTMLIAQSLYEGVALDGRTAGLVTYVRTDSVALSKGAAESARGIVRERFGVDYFLRKARVFRSLARNVQEAHEAIRPTDLARTLRRGRYGRFVQRGERDDPRSARGTVPAAIAADEITPEVTRAPLVLPRTVGKHPETGKRILAGIGRYRVWLKHGNDYTALPDDEDVLGVSPNRAAAPVDARGGERARVLRREGSRASRRRVATGRASDLLLSDGLRPCGRSGPSRRPRGSICCTQWHAFG